MQCAQVIGSMGGGVLSTVLPPPDELPAKVQAKQGELIV